MKFQMPAFVTDRFKIKPSERLTTQFCVVYRSERGLTASDRLVAQQGQNGLYKVSAYREVYDWDGGANAPDPLDWTTKLSALFNGGYPDGDLTRDEALKELAKFEEKHPRDANISLKGRIPYFAHVQARLALGIRAAP